MTRLACLILATLTALAPARVAESFPCSGAARQACGARGCCCMRMSGANQGFASTTSPSIQLPYSCGCVVENRQAPDQDKHGADPFLANREKREPIQAPPAAPVSFWCYGARSKARPLPLLPSHSASTVFRVLRI